MNKPGNRLSGMLNRIGRLSNTIGIGVLVGMMFLTVSDVFLRYVFNWPVRGTFELTEFMMLVVIWLGVAYTAIKKGHVAIDVLVKHFPRRIQTTIDSIGYFFCLSIAFLIAWRGVIRVHALWSSGEASSVLHIPSFPFEIVLVFGSGLLCLVLLVQFLESLPKLAEGGRIGYLWLLLGVIWLGFLSSPIWLSQVPQISWQISRITVGYIGIVILLILLALRTPIAFAMAGVGFLGLIYLSGMRAGFTALEIVPFTTTANYTLSCVPLFVLMGLFCFHSGISQDLYQSAYKWLGQLPGGLAMATVAACAGFAAVSGSSMATAATMGTVALPEMKRYDYDSELATGSVAAGGTLGILIPPSLGFILYAILTEQSIGKLFMAGILPGVLLAALFIVLIYVRARHNIKLGPPGPRTSILEKAASLKNTWGMLTLFVLVMGGIYMGIFTPTEAAGIGAFGAFIFAIVKRQLNRQNLMLALLETGRVAGMFLFILVGAMIFSYFLAVTQLPFELANFVTSLPMSRFAILAGILFIYLVLGCIMEITSALVLTLPIFFPAVIALGFDPIWFGVLMVLVQELGLITPPVGLNVFVLSGVAKDVPMSTIFRGVVPFVIVMIIFGVILIVFPQISLFLPNVMM